MCLAQGTGCTVYLFQTRPGSSDTEVSTNTENEMTLLFDLLPGGPTEIL